MNPVTTHATNPTLGGVVALAATLLCMPAAAAGTQTFPVFTNSEWTASTTRDWTGSGSGIWMTVVQPVAGSGTEATIVATFPTGTNSGRTNMINQTIWSSTYTTETTSKLVKTVIDRHASDAGYLHTCDNASTGSPCGQVYANFPVNLGPITDGSESNSTEAVRLYERWQEGQWVHSATPLAYKVYTAIPPALITGERCIGFGDAATTNASVDTPPFTLRVTEQGTGPLSSLVTNSHGKIQCFGPRTIPTTVVNSCAFRSSVYTTNTKQNYNRKPSAVTTTSNVILALECSASTTVKITSSAGGNVVATATGTTPLDDITATAFIDTTPIDETPITLDAGTMRELPVELKVASNAAHSVGRVALTAAVLTITVQ
ncbi:hypothetical protein ACW5XW_20375 [Aeromonas piscicola]|uniref:hypothetical protein n=1 Tax=Aeromonas piscicola TaxID=600645 RepID=UPI000A4E3718|nr:hypothetical protein [Aeromonas piscicola]